MKLILKDGQELIITRANDTYSYEGYKDGLGNDMNRNIVATISIFNSDKSLNTIKDMITDENRTGFKIIYGNTQKDYTGMKIESISEEISNERSVINISLATDKTMGKLYEKAGGNDIYHEKLLPDIESLEVRYTKDNVL